jgi:hypothetical protein
MKPTESATFARMSRRWTWAVALLLLAGTGTGGCGASETRATSRDGGADAPVTTRQSDASLGAGGSRGTGGATSHVPIGDGCSYDLGCFCNTCMETCQCRGTLGGPGDCERQCLGLTCGKQRCPLDSPGSPACCLGDRCGMYLRLPNFQGCLERDRAGSPDLTCAPLHFANDPTHGFPSVTFPGCCTSDGKCGYVIPQLGCAQWQGADAGLVSCAPSDGGVISDGGRDAQSATDEAGEASVDATVRPDAAFHDGDAAHCLAAPDGDPFTEASCGCLPQTCSVYGFSISSCLNVTTDPLCACTWLSGCADCVCQ